MKVKLKFKNTQELLALMELCRVHSIEDVWHQLLHNQLSEVRVRMAMALTKKTWMGEKIKGSISVTHAEILAIYLNHKPELCNPMTVAQYNLQIAPHLHIVKNTHEQN